MKFIGIDYGALRVGVALSDANGAFAFPHAVYTNDQTLLQRLAQLAKQEGATTFVVGDARALSGGENVITQEADAFARALGARGFTVERVREAWTTQEAARFAPRGKTHDDSAAAALLLQRFLDTHTVQ